MKVLKYILIGIVALVAILLIVSAFMPAKMTTVRTIVINAPAASVFEEVNEYKNWNKWSPWYALEPTMEQTYSEPSAGEGAWTSWKGKEMGEGKQTIVESRPNEYIKTLLEFGGMDSKNYSDFTFRDSAGSTVVEWGFDGAEMPFYMRMMNVMMKGMLDKEFDNGLQNLKTLCESKTAGPAKMAFEIHETDMMDRVYIAKRDSVSWEKIGEFYQTNLPAIFEAAGKAKLEPAGSPTGLFFKWDDTNKSALMAAAIPVKGDAKTVVKGFETIVVPAGKNLHIAYMGSYEKSGDAHYAMDAYMKEKSMEQINPVIEEYVTDPMSEPDTSKWLTNIYYPVK